MRTRSTVTSNVYYNNLNYNKKIMKTLLIPDEISKIVYDMDQIGFIILRHVNSELTNQYWIHCYNCIRKHYPENMILIIDDNSDYRYITNKGLYKTLTINSEYPGRGELLPYYYYLQYKLFDTAVILHDSAFINSFIDFHVDKYKIIWDFEHNWDQIEDETKMINMFNDKSLLEFYEDKNKWTGCFGCMSVITHDFLESINTKYDISKLLDCVLTRYNRSSFERVIACLLQKECQVNVLLGNIHEYVYKCTSGCRSWGITFHDKDLYENMPIVKVWTGR